MNQITRLLLVFMFAIFATIILSPDLAIASTFLVGAAVAEGQRREHTCSNHRAGLPLGSGESVFGLTVAFFDASGFGSNTPDANGGVRGIWVENYDNSNGGDGSVVGEVREDGKYLFDFDGAVSQADVNSPCYAVDNNTLSKTPSAQGFGRISELGPTSTSAWVRLLPGEILVDTDT